MRTVTTRFINTLIKNISMQFGEVKDEQNKTGSSIAPLISASRLNPRFGRAAMYELIIIKHSQTKWEWQLCDNKGNVRKQGFESNRRLAKYRGERALFLLLAAGTNGDTGAGWKTQ